MNGLKTRITVITLGIMILSLTSNGFAQPDYSKLKGDFNIFKLGDTKNKVIGKLKYLEQKGEIREVSGADQFMGVALNEKVLCRFIFHKILGSERVQKMVIDFSDRRVVPGQFDVEGMEFIKHLEIMLTKVYGPPSYTCPYLFEYQIKTGQDKYVDKWIILSKSIDPVTKWPIVSKTVGISVTRDEQFVYTQIIISRSGLLQDEIQEFN